MGYDDDRPIILRGPGWERLPDGSFQLVVECPTEVHYATLPKTLMWGKEKLRLYGWDSDRRMAYYRAPGDGRARCRGI